MNRYIDANDLISRQAAIDAFWKLDVEIRPSAINAIIDMIRTLPHAETPKRTTQEESEKPYKSYHPHSQN